MLIKRALDGGVRFAPLQAPLKTQNLVAAPELDHTISHTISISSLVTSPFHFVRPIVELRGSFCLPAVFRTSLGISLSCPGKMMKQSALAFALLAAGAALAATNAANALRESSGSANNVASGGEEDLAKRGEFGCCSAWGNGDIHAPLVMYGATLADKKKEDGGKDKSGGRHIGFYGINVKKELAIRLVGCTCPEKAEAGHFLFRCPTNNKLTAIAWGPSGCTAYEWPDYIPFPKQCVGTKSLEWSLYRDTVHKDWATHLLRYQPPCKMATIAVNPASCIPHEATMNLTRTKKDEDKEGAHSEGAKRGFSLENLKWFETKKNKDKHHTKYSTVTSNGLRVPEGWRCTEGFGCHTISGYVALSFRDTEARAPDAHHFGVPSWCEKGRQLVESCGVKLQDE